VIFSIRDARPEDQIPIIDCDIKCFDLAWTTDCWAVAAGNYVLKVATFYGTVIGFVTYLHDEDEQIVRMPKLGVKPAYRNKGVGNSLLAEVKTFARQLNARHIETVVPESILRPGEPAFIGDWMNKTGWKATGLVKQFFPSMGDMEDGVKFILQS
jgi:ribosomal protein S18 acetylase RimI-like enzyme